MYMILRILLTFMAARTTPIRVRVKPRAVK
jgi:hypothetical protein